MYKILTIAGSDPSGGAGIQADLKTIAAHGMYGMSVVTALTAQNTTGVFGVREIEPEFVGQQLDAVFTDIRPDAVKIGMAPSAAIIRVIAAKLREHGARPVVLDPVMVATSGGRLMHAEAKEALVSELFPLAAVITPNMAEAAELSGLPVGTRVEMFAAAARIAGWFAGCILLKGGHLSDGADDLLYSRERADWLQEAHVPNPDSHGTGCTLSAALACRLAAGETVRAGVEQAKAYVTGALKAGLRLGRGRGPLDHMYALKTPDARRELT
ncbi:MAG: bifunctional hydroxymethylpyrimidine kinase/phosphomethylpyrimidine kinase [Gracilibacteraceae bacterium]|jgi:hydroxymethylpyrimidine/phosphomethylpyrimidine kinase|nr:bifunctional hydroxymethylpyrimidine kinase/phosphomethylpyrimidine kinase [Gracilibacteraceae bacterium]